MPRLAAMISTQCSSLHRLRGGPGGAGIHRNAPGPEGQRRLLQGMLFIAIGAYFSWCWSRTGQTLALKTWNLRVDRHQRSHPSRRAPIARYVLAYTLALPGLAYIARRSPPVRARSCALALGFSGCPRRPLVRSPAALAA